VNGDISERVKKLVGELDNHLKNFNAEEIEVLGVPLNDLRDEIREAIQENMREPAERLIRKLKKNEDLTLQEIQTIERWIVGDAEYYAKVENNLLDWMGECKRLCSVLDSYAFQGVEKDDNKLLSLGAVLTDLKCTLDDVIRYSEAMNRVDRFRSSIGAGKLTSETKKWLAEMLERQLASAEF
jgi:type I site-specific restriction endonuclease